MQYYNKSNSSNSNIQQQRKRICQTIQYSPILDTIEHDTVGEVLCSAHQLLEVGNSSNSNSTASATTDSDKTIEKLNDAITKVMIWKNRVVSQHIPHAIDCTVSIVQVLIRDAANPNISSTASRRSSTDRTNPASSIITATTTTTTNELRHLYASVIVRCVNGLADVLQQQRSVATSIANLCDEIGIPKYIVAIRHEATHNHLPSLCILRMVSKTLLQYLQNVYWIPMQQRHSIQPLQTAQHVLQCYEIAIQQKQEEVKEKQRQQQTLPQQWSHSSNESNTKGNVDDDDTTSDNYDDYDDANMEDEIMIDGLYQSIPGTTSNRFAVLLEEDSKKKRTIPKLQTTNSKTPSHPAQSPPVKNDNNETPRRKKQKADRTSTSANTSNDTSTTNESKYIQSSTEHRLSPPQEPIPFRYTVATCSKAYVQLHHHHVSIDMLQRVAMDHIIKQTKVYVLHHTINHTFLVDENDIVPKQQQRRQQVQHQLQHTQFLYRYRPLLGSIARVWPGFCSRFLSHCVLQIIRGGSVHNTDDDGMKHDHVDSYHDQHCDAASRPLNIIQYPLYGIMIEGWIHLLLSNNFLQQIDIPPSLAVTTKRTTTTTPMYMDRPIIVSLIYKNEKCLGSLELFRQFQYPLNRYCDQIMNMSKPYPNDDLDRVRIFDVLLGRILDMFTFILGEERSPQYDIIFNDHDDDDAPPKNFQNHPNAARDSNVGDSSSTGAVIAAAATTTKHPPKMKSKQLSLEDMEELLVNASNAKRIHNNRTMDDTKHSSLLQLAELVVTGTKTNESNRRSPSPPPPPKLLLSKWTQCSTWEPCAIGTIF